MFLGRKSAAVLLFVFSTISLAADFPGTKTNWQGFDCYQFDINGRPAKVVCPKEPAAGNPWVWRAVFFGPFECPSGVSSNTIPTVELARGWAKSAKVSWRIMPPDGGEVAR